jgi:hypothetical protein
MTADLSKKKTDWNAELMQNLQFTFRQKNKLRIGRCPGLATDFSRFSLENQIGR